ncbi:MAG: SlyX family protein [Methylococcales bacterium]|nr:SlyX family protein [Methylococcales bacterium]
MLENRIIELEIKVAYQEDLLQTLNDIIAMQQQQIDNLSHAYKSMHERVTNLASKMPEDANQNHEIPPHY